MILVVVVAAVLLAVYVVDIGLVAVILLHGLNGMFGFRS